MDSNILEKVLNENFQLKSKISDMENEIQLLKDAMLEKDKHSNKIISECTELKLNFENSIKLANEARDKYNHLIKELKNQKH